MSAPKRRPQQPPYQPQQQHYQQHYHHQIVPLQQYAQDGHYSQYPGSPYQQQQLYYQPQQYPSADPYAAQASASTSPYPQHVYQNNLYQSQPYAPSTRVGYPNPTPIAYPQGGGYLAAATDYNAAADLSPNHLTPGSMSSGHSPRPSAGRARLSNFVFPSQGTSPSLESQVAHLHLAAPLPSKPGPYQGSNPASRPASGMAQPSSPIAFASANEQRSQISLRYPPLPSLPERCATPPLLRSVNPEEAEGAKTSEGAAVDPSVLEYISSLRSILAAYAKRDDLLRLRTEAVGFQPRQAWSAWQSPQQSPSSTDDHLTDDPHTNPILGVRLLQRLDNLQRENDELEHLLSSGARLTSSSASVGRETEELRKEVHDCHRLIEAMDAALGSAEARAAAAERALEVACRNNSTAMVPAKVVANKDSATVAPAVDAEDRKSATKHTPKKGPKPAKASTNGAKGGASQQQRSHPIRSPGANKSTRTDKPATNPPKSK